MVHGVWRGTPPTLVALNDRQHPTTAEWDACLATARALLGAGESTPLRALAISDGGGPTSRQRAQAAEVAAGHELRWALISSSRFARGIGSALSWLVGGFRAFAPHELRQTLYYLAVPPAEAPDLLRMVRSLDAPTQLAGVAQLEQAEQQLE